RLGVHRTHDKKFLMHASDSSTTSEYWVVPADKPNDQFQVVRARKEGVEYSLDHRDGLFYIRNNDKDRTNYCIQTVAVPDMAKGQWSGFLPSQEAVFNEGHLIFKDFAVIDEREAGLPQIRIYDFKTKSSHRVSFPEAAYQAGLGANPEFDSDTIRFNYTSLVT